MDIYPMNMHYALLIGRAVVIWRGWLSYEDVCVPSHCSTFEKCT